MRRVIVLLAAAALAIVLGQKTDAASLGLSLEASPKATAIGSAVSRTDAGPQILLDAVPLVIGGVTGTGALFGTNELLFSVVFTKDIAGAIRGATGSFSAKSGGFPSATTLASSGSIVDFAISASGAGGADVVELQFADVSGLAATDFTGGALVTLTGNLGFGPDRLLTPLTDADIRLNAIAPAMSTIPLPAAALMLLSAMAALGVLRWRRDVA